MTMTNGVLLCLATKHIQPRRSLWVGLLLGRRTKLITVLFEKRGWWTIGHGVVVLLIYGIVPIVFLDGRFDANKYCVVI